MRTTAKGRFVGHVGWAYLGGGGKAPTLRAHSELPLLALQKIEAETKAETQEKWQNGFSLLLFFKNEASCGTGKPMEMISV